MVSAVAAPSFRDFVAAVNPRYAFYAHCELLIAQLERVAAGEITRLLVLMPPRHGKCLAKGSPVLMADGRLVPIEEINRSDMVISLNSCYNVTTESVIATQENGVKPVLRITLQSGRFIDCTENHPLLTVLGWREAGTLKVGDHIAAVRQVAIPAGAPLPFGFAALMGYITGDGSYAKGNPIITAAEPATVTHLEEIAAHHGWVLRRDGKYGYHIRKPTRTGWGNGSSAQERLREYLTPAKSAEKRVPQAIFQAGREDLCAFLAAYFNCDGTATGGRGGIAEFYSTSEGLLRDVQHLLTRLSIYSALRPKRGRYQGRIHESWRLIITGQDLVLLADALPVLGERGQQLRAQADVIRDGAHYPEYDAIPNGWQALMQQKLWWHRRHTGVRADKQYKYGTARHIVRAIAEAEDNDALRRVCSPDVIWERIVKIEEFGEAPTYDIQIETTQNFIVNNIVVHNSELVSRLFSAYYLLRYPARWIGLTSYAADLSTTFSRAARDNYQRAGGAIRDDASAVKHWQTPQGGGMWAAGVGGPITGKGFHLGIIDDPIKNAEDAASATMRAKQVEWYGSTWSTREEPDAAQIVVLTRWHAADLAGHLLTLAADGDGDAWTIVDMPAIADAADAPSYPVSCPVIRDDRPDGAPLCPERYPLARLEAIARRIGPYFFGALFQQRPRPRDGGMFGAAAPIIDVLPPIVRRVRYWDKAGAAPGKGDYTVGALLAVTADERYVVEDIVRGQWPAAERNARIRETAELDRARGHVTIYVEQPPGLGKESTDTVIRLLAGFPVTADPVHANKIERAEPFAAQWQAGNVSLRRAAWNTAYLEELRGFPTGRNDDQVDASSGAFNRAVAAREAHYGTDFLTDWRG